MLHENAPKKELGVKAMILSAGLGTRLKPWTDEHPKALAVVNNKSLLQRNVEYLQQFGITEIIVNVHHFADQVVNAIEKNNGWGSQIKISDETDEVLETGGGLLKAAPFLQSSDPFVLMNVDILTDVDLHSMISYHKKNTPIATLATSNRNTSRYLLFNETDRLVGWKNVLTGEEKLSVGIQTGLYQQRAFSGLHIISPQIFSLVQQTGKFSMIDVYLGLMHQNKILSYDVSGSKFIDVGKPESVEMAERMFG